MELFIVILGVLLIAGTVLATREQRRNDMSTRRDASLDDLVRDNVIRQPRPDGSPGAQDRRDGTAPHQ